METSPQPYQDREFGLEATSPPGQLKYSDMPRSEVDLQQQDQSQSVVLPSTTKAQPLEPLTAPERDHPSISPEEEEMMFRALRAVFEDAGENEADLELGQLMASLELADKEAVHGCPNIEVLEGVKSRVYQLWRSQSSYMARVTEVLANGSRNHENRQQVVDRNYTLSIIRLLGNPALVHVAIPVVYNICVDFGLSLAQAPDDSLSMIIAIASNSDIALPHYISIVNSLAAYLQNDRFQILCLLHGHVELVLSVLFDSYEMERGEMSPEDEQALAMSRLKLNHALSDLSGLPIYSKTYDLFSAVTKTLMSWLRTSKDHLQICACVMLGNLAREDAICESMIQELKVHLPLIAILDSNPRSTVLHSVLGFLKNLTIAGNNKEHLGEAGIIERLSKLWTAETIPQIQFLAASLTRQVVLSSVANISRLLGSLSPDPDSPAHSRTYLSNMLSLFSKTDSPPTRTEIGRTIAAICRVLLRLNPGPEAADTTQQLTKRLFDLHEDVARPIEAMIVQSEWPVLRSEGWFALALMASNKNSCEAVGDCLQGMSITEILCETVRRRASEPSEGESAHDKAERVRLAKDRENTLILLHGLLQHNPSTLTSTRREIFEDLMHDVGHSNLQ
ncbi:predicted protein [Uncinocarpus reesii 1704]|uniref:GTP binding protein n=1 Tax=Uncinocarpus reesii (strain UAMH 1704) TaxID=336963 RepID=C4JH46_UNCRE|nr:uncharacterized protein UREG_02619 [Uncinocarpus reesii 1704]EEP77770.1 predicted protein [Uncinocarpus reesii 1704]